MKKRLSVLALLYPLVVSATTWYVATNGSDFGNGSLSNPFLTIGKAVSTVQAGEIIYVRGGVYNLTSTIVLNESGIENSTISLFAYPGERPILDCSTMAVNSSNSLCEQGTERLMANSLCATSTVCGP